MLMLKKESESGVVDLPEDEPEIIKLLIQYLYEAEYNPVLPTGSQVKAYAVALLYRSSYQDNFPHSCKDGDDPNNIFVSAFSCRKRLCSHHTCNESRGTCCQNFSCELCTAPSAPLSPPAGNAEDLLLHAKMYEIGDKYEVIGLKGLAKDKFKASCKHFWRTPSFAVAARHAFSTTVEDDKGLRDIVSATISEHLQLVGDPEVDAIMTDFKGLALGVLRTTLSKQEHWKSRWD